MPRWLPYILEVGSGIDLHGEDVTKAAQRAIKDAISHSSMIGLGRLLGFRGLAALNEGLMVDVTIATPYPEKVDEKAVLEVLPEGKRKITVVEGGIRWPTSENVDHQSIHGVIAVNAVIIVLVDAEKLSVAK